MPDRDDSRYSLMHVPEQKVYMNGTDGRSLVGKPHPEYAHVQAVDGPSVPLGRIPESSPRPRRRDCDLAGSARPGCFNTRQDSKKRFGVADPVVWNAIQRAMAQQKRLSSIVPHDSSPEKAGVVRRPSVPSRTSSRRKALDRFARELEKYARVSNAPGKLPVITPTESEEKASLRTMKPLVPYAREFEAAGLAVTSEQQKNASPQKVDEQCQPRKSNAIDYGLQYKSHERNIDGKYESSSASGSVTEFSPPPATAAKVAKPIPVKKPIPRSLSKKPSPQVRRQLPWLRRKRHSREQDAQPPQRVGTMVEAKKGEWKIADEETQPRPKVNGVTTVKHGQRDTDKYADRKSLYTQALPETPARIRPSIVRPHITEYINKIPGGSKRYVHKPQGDTGHRFRQCKELEQGPLPCPTPNMKEVDPNTRPHHHPFFKHHHHSPFHRLHHVHGAPVTLTAQKTETSPTRQLHHIKPAQSPSSPAPELPYTWKYAVSNASSLERALNAAQQRVDKMESQAVQPLGPLTGTKGTARQNKPYGYQYLSSHKHHNHHPLLAKESCLDHHGTGYGQTSVEPAVTKAHVNTGTTFGQEQFSSWTNNEDTNRKDDGAATSPPSQQRSPLMAKGNGYQDKQYPEDKSLNIPNEPTAQLHVLKKENERKISDNVRNVAQQSLLATSIGETQAAAVCPPSELEVAFKELDVFFDTDDANIEDRDVLQGLQVAVKAAADDMYDALLRNKTGLRIRRFLADLKSIDAVHAELAVYQPARRQGPEKRRSERIKRG